VWENLQYLLGEHPAKSEVYLGRLIPKQTPHGYMSGGAGYVLSKPAVRKIVDEGPQFPDDCPTDGKKEDLHLGRYSCEAFAQFSQRVSTACYAECCILAIVNPPVSLSVCHTLVLCRKVKGKGNCIAVYGTPSHSYGVSLAIWAHTVLPAARHK